MMSRILARKIRHQLRQLDLMKLSRKVTKKVKMIVKLKSKTRRIQAN